MVSFEESQLKFISEMTSNAENISEAFKNKFGGALDYSVKSLNLLDELLEEFHKNKNEIDEETKNVVIAQIGSYIFEVARRNYGGNYYWYAELNEPILVTGEPKFEIALIAFDRVKMRIENGKDDQIPFYFKFYEERVRQAKEGDKALIN